MKRAVLLVVMTVACAATDFVLDPQLLNGLGALMLSGIAAVGGVVASRRPGNPIGWLLCVIALGFSGAVAGDGIYTHADAVAGAWIASWIWVPSIVSIGLFALLFPTGQPPSDRWRPVLWGMLGVTGFLLFGTAFAEGELEDYPGVANPFGLGVVEIFGQAGFLVVMVAIAAAIAAMIVRFRRSKGIERQQLKWVMVAALGFPIAMVAPVDGDLGFVMLLAAALLLALAVAAAILRYRLYDIDVVIRRTLVYAVLTASLAATYLVSVLVLQLVLPERSDLAVAASTLAAAALFVPARRRIQDVVDRRFFRSRYDAQQTLEAFGARLRDEVSLSALDTELREVVAQTLQPAHISVWIRR